MLKVQLNTKIEQIAPFLSFLDFEAKKVNTCINSATEVNFQDL